MHPTHIQATRIFFYTWILLLQLTICNNSVAADVTQQQLLDRLDTKDEPLILDVRRPDEYAAGHVPHAINIPHTEIGNRLQQLRPDINKEIVVYCESGRRAAIAGDILTRAGFTNVLHLQGDMKGWRMRGLPLQEDSSDNVP